MQYGFSKPGLHLPQRLREVDHGLRGSSWIGVGLVFIATYCSVGNRFNFGCRPAQSGLKSLASGSIPREPRLLGRGAGVKSERLPETEAAALAAGSLQQDRFSERNLLSGSFIRGHGAFEASSKFKWVSAARRHCTLYGHKNGGSPVHAVPQV